MAFFIILLYDYNLRNMLIKEVASLISEISTPPNKA